MIHFFPDDLRSTFEDGDEYTDVLNSQMSTLN